MSEKVMGQSVACEAGSTHLSRGRLCLLFDLGEHSDAGYKLIVEVCSIMSNFKG